MFSYEEATMNVDNGNPAAFGRKAVARRPAPSSGNAMGHSNNAKNISSNSSKNISSKSQIGPLSSLHSSKANSKAKEKREDDEDLEARPLLSGGDASGAESAATVTAGQAAKFADTWMGTMLKVKAKQAGKHIYNLRANMASKKGFHVQVPKRMLFYTTLVFLVLPLLLFFREEKHIHHKDGIAHHENKSHDRDFNQNHVSQENLEHQQSKERLRGHPKQRKKVTKESLTELLGGNATSPSKSREDNPKQIVKVQEEAAQEKSSGKSTEKEIKIGNAANNSTGLSEQDVHNGATEALAEKVKRGESEGNLDNQGLSKEGDGLIAKPILLHNNAAETNMLADKSETGPVGNTDETNATKDHATHDEERR